MADEHKLFVGKLPTDITEEELRIVFNTYGKVQNVHIMSKGRPDDDRGPRFACAFVYYNSDEACKAAIQVLDNIYKIREDARDPIHVSFALAGGDKGGNRGRRDDRDNDRRDDRDRDRSRGRGGYDRGPPPRDHYDHYDHYGKGGKGGGYDRGGYGGPPERGGYPDRGGYPPHHEPYRDSWGPGRDEGYGRSRYNDRSRHDDYDRGYGKEKGGNSRGGDRGGDYISGSSKLYVANLPSDIQQEAMEMVFSTYGRIEDIKIMTGRSKSGQACAFVKYSTPNEARIAIAAMERGYEIRPGEGDILVKSADPDSKDRGRDGRDGGKGGGKDRDRDRDRDRGRPY